MTTKNQNKTQATDVDPCTFLAEITHPVRRADGEYLLGVFDRVTGGMPARMWGPSIIGYGRYHYKYDSGREGDGLVTGFSPRKANLVFYVMPGYQDFSDELFRLGKHRLGKSCLYINKLADIDLEVLEEIIAKGLTLMQSRYQVHSI